jgi:dTDP-4-amino-4,6-dideoxygalactose transaminase
MDGLQAAVLSVKLKYLSQWTDSRIANAAIYTSCLKGSDVVVPRVIAKGKHVFHLYVIKTTNRAELIAKLKENEIAAVVHYPVALPFLKCYSNMGHTPADFPVAHKVTQEIVSLPMFAELDEEMIQRVCKVI